MDTLDEETPVRSNVMPVTNVAIRNPALSITQDIAFVSQVRGAKAIQHLIRRITGFKTGNYDSGDMRIIKESLTKAQFAQRNGHLVCPRCRRVDFGLIRQPNGSAKWGYLEPQSELPCRCMR